MSLTIGVRFIEGGAIRSKTGGLYAKDKTRDESSRDAANVEESSTNLG